MEIAIVGLPGAGKTTVFNALTRGHVRTGVRGGMELHVGTVKVPDPRLERLAAIYRPKRIVPADVTYVDFPAPPPSAGERIGTEELPPEHVARLREADALLHVVRAFEDPANPHPAGRVDPRRDVETLALEFVLADLAIVRRRLERLERSGRHGTPAEREAAAREAALLTRLAAELEAERPLRLDELDEDEERRLRGFGLLTRKPLFVLLNVGEDDLPRVPELVAGVAEILPAARTAVDALPGRLEAELAELDPDEAEALRRAYGLAESPLERVVRTSYRLLGLISFLTAGPEEVRAWPIPAGSTAVDAAAAIHTDLARGFIRAEVVPFDDLVALGSAAEARRHGKLRAEGRSYLVQDGDVIEILFTRPGGGR